MTKLSPLQIERLKYQPKLPSSLQNGVNSLELVEGSATQSVRDQEQIQALLGEATALKNKFKSDYIKSVDSINIEFKDDTITGYIYITTVYTKGVRIDV